MDFVNIINLNKRTDRLLSFANEFRNQGCPIMIWDGVTSMPTIAGNIGEAHKRIVRWAKESGLPRVTIAEDDIVFTANGAWKYYIDNIPNEYDIYFSMIYSGEIADNRISVGFSGMTMYTVNSLFYDFFLSCPSHAHIDRWLGMSCHINRYIVCPEFVCRQSGGYSDNLKRVMHYDEMLKERKLFGISSEVQTG